MNNDIVRGFDNGEMEGLTVRLARVPTVDGCLVLQCIGLLDLYNYDPFQKRVAKAIEAGFTRLVFDLHAVHHMSSLPIGGLAMILRSVRAKGGDLVLQDVQPRVYEVLQLLGLSGFFTFTAALEDSVAHIAHLPGDVSFPRVFACPICEVRLRAARAGRFRCAHCRTVLALAATGAVDLG
jgi:anti-sigma B factor antagonist